MQAFFRRVKKGQKPGFPRYKGAAWWNSFGFNEFSGITICDNRLRFKGMTGGLRIHLHRPLPEGKILSCQFRRDPKGWCVCLQVRTAAMPLAPTGKRVGVDVGLSSLAVLTTGEVIPNIKSTKRYERQLRIRQRQLSRCKRGSNGRRKARSRPWRGYTPKSATPVKRISIR